MTQQVTYDYKNIPDKSKEGLEKELKNGLTIAAVFFHTTLGVPLEMFNLWLRTKLKNRAEQWLWYMKFRNEHPELY